ncbi:hypothetical protein M011DRAFT_414289 [Sporormia fimetaria CBS 119925]|uniref:Uncharacterized protein n=1 Tax=Sporormia fimetaria CBS 119925 TaxID=1340428 RepID=A0A6A6VPC0_9PLEO|nr:hypothetical protein M011DRAFT_414289 [Sporormia fimetaria CBS 119925]
MATLRSLGLHTPAALHYLIAESVLHEDSTESDYTWETFYHEDDGGEIRSDELVTTKYHVVWSQGNVVRKSFNFEVEKEPVIQALLTWFPSEQPSPDTGDAGIASGHIESHFRQSFLTQGTQPASDPSAPAASGPRVVEGKARALVVLLKSQAHVFFLSGATHLVHLPFEVERAFPAPRGVLLQRKRPRADPFGQPAAPLPPSAPPNSFMTYTQSFIGQPISQTLSQSFSQPPRPAKSLKQGSANALFLQELVKSTSLYTSDGLPRLYSLSDPLSELALVVHAVTGHERGLLTVNGSGHRRLEPIDKNEDILYVSAQNEIRFDRTGSDQPLLFVITTNRETNTLTIWSAAYLAPKSISNSRKAHATHTSSKRRRSSYGPTAPGTGASTPLPRGADRMRESFGIMTRSKTRRSSMNTSSQPKERLSDQAVEEVLASQLNPESDLSRHPQESRRVSSLLSRAELSTSFDKSAFQDLATQRTSLGGSFKGSFGNSQKGRQSLSRDRTSFGGFSQRNRASTPGSVVSRLSFGGGSVDDTLEDIMDEDTLDTIEDFDELDDLFSPPDAGSGHDSMHGLRKELVLSPVAELSLERYLRPAIIGLGDISAAQKGDVKVYCVAAPFNSATLHERLMHVYLKHSSLSHPLRCELSITRKRLTTAALQPKANNVSRYGCRPRFVKVEEMVETDDIIRLKDGQAERIACLTSKSPAETCLSLTAGWGTHLPMRFSLPSLRMFDPYEIASDTAGRHTAGRSRTITAKGPLLCLLPSDQTCNFDLLDSDLRRHRLQLLLLPEDPFVTHLFRALSTILPNYTGELLLEIWWHIRKNLGASDQHKNLDWVAFVTTLFSLAIPFVDERTVKSLGTKSAHKRGSSRLANQARSEALDDRSAWASMCSRHDSRPHNQPGKSATWAWVHRAQPLSSAAIQGKSSQTQASTSSHTVTEKHKLILECIALARSFAHSPIGKAAHDVWRRLSSEKQDLRISCLSECVVTLHLVREEHRLDVLSQDYSGSEARNLTPILAQLGHWLRWNAWSWTEGGFYDLDARLRDNWIFEDSHLKSSVRLHSEPWSAPPSVLEWLCTALRSQTYIPFPTVAILVRKSKASPHSSVNLDEMIQRVAPRTAILHNFLQDIDKLSEPRKAVELMERCRISTRILETLPEAARAPLMEALMRCQANPPTTWPRSLLELVQREDLDVTAEHGNSYVHDMHQVQSSAATRDMHTVCQALDLGQKHTEPLQSTAEAERHFVTRLIFKEDQRFIDARLLLEPLRAAVAEYAADARADETAILEGQKAFMQWVMVRTFSLPMGNSMLRLGSRRPLLTEKYHLLGFSSSCVFKPMGNHVTAERQNYSEEKFFWAFFHAGVSAGLCISPDAQGIDTSWILFNKPAELTNKHAGLLLGLGLNGHLKTIAKWLSFKYLTPKHTTTSVGLLLGLAASFMGTMDTLVARLLSVHVTRMLPPGAAELNLSPYTQTTGLMGIGLLYYNTQHRRMSEVMLSEIEHVEEIDPSEPPDTLRDEAYRLAAGFALGFINLGKGNDLRGLHDMRIIERLMAVAVAPKPVDIVHTLDQATAGAVIAVALIFMKTHNEAVAKKIDVPDTLPQFDYVRPDIFLLRTLAKHLIMWDNIAANGQWIKQNLPREYRKSYDLKTVVKLSSEQMPFFNILAGLLWSISLKYAGTGDLKVRDFLVAYLDQFIRINKLPALRYDSKLARNTARNCQDLIALAAITVMAGTGDLEIFRRLRGLHGRVGPDTPYGSHLASHMALGALFLAGGTQTFSTSNKAIACLICAFYPLFPMEVQDSKAHLQAFRHFWVLAAEPRCLVVRDVDTSRPISMPVIIHLKNETQKKLQAPCLIPEFHTIDRIETESLAYWPATLDFANNPLHLKTFQTNQTIRVRRRAASDLYNDPFSAALVALNETQGARTARLMWEWIFELPALRGGFEGADLGLILPVDASSSMNLDTGSTVVDHRLMLRRLGRSCKASELWELRGIFEWAEGVSRTGNGRLRWLGRGVVERIRAGVLERGRGLVGGG